jgi:protein TonB
MGVRFATRATSLSAAALLLGAAVLAALSMRFIVNPTPDTTPPPFDTVVRPPDPPKPLPEPPKPVVRPIAPTDPLPPIAQPPVVDVSQPPMATPIPFSDPRPQASVYITRPDWLRRPTNLESYYHVRARDRGVEGVVQLDCLVQIDGRLDCDVVSETPGGWQFANAALRMARDHRMVPATRDGVPVEARYRMRVPFNLDER